MSFLLGTLLHSFRESAFKMIIRFKGLFYRCILFMLTSTVIVWMAVFLYGTFYYTYMPSVSHVKPVYFKFRSCVEKDGPCSNPTANISLIKKGHEQLLMRGQEYKVYLELNMPESQKNQQVGMFMVKIDFYARMGEIVRTSSRAAMLRHKSSLLCTLSTMFFSPFLLMGSLEERQVLNIELFDYYEEDPRWPAVGTIIEIQSHNVQFYSAALHIYANFTGLRYLMFHWPLLSAIVGIGTILFFLSVIALLSWYRCAIVKDSAQVVVRVGFDDSQRVDQRRKQVRDFLMRERQRQSSLRDSGSEGKSRSPRLMDRTRSLETLPISRVQELAQEPVIVPTQPQEVAGKKGLSIESEEPITTQQKGSDDEEGAITVRQRKLAFSEAS